MPPITIRRSYADTPDGQIHYAEAGQGKPVLLLHQTPRSWDEFRDVLPILGRKYRALAMDTIGFGDSYRLKGEASIEVFARGVVQLMDALFIRQASIVGHHTGGVVAVEVAAAHPDRVEKLILSSTPYVDAEDREKRKIRPPIDDVEEKPDGSHLCELWQRRMSFYPKSRPDLEQRVPLIKAPTLVLGGTDDPFSYPRMRPLAEHILGSKTAEIKGGMVPMVDQMPEEFAKVVMDFLDSPPRH
jgi:pimeloyl-ACP methyl ester carboxylesterase